MAPNRPQSHTLALVLGTTTSTTSSHSDLTESTSPYLHRHLESASHVSSQPSPLAPHRPNHHSYTVRLSGPSFLSSSFRHLFTTTWSTWVPCQPHTHTSNTSNLQSGQTANSSLFDVWPDLPIGHFWTSANLANLLETSKSFVWSNHSLIGVYHTLLGDLWRGHENSTFRRLARPANWSLLGLWPDLPIHHFWALLPIWPNLPKLASRRENTSIPRIPAIPMGPCLGTPFRGPFRGALAQGPLNGLR